MNIGFVGVGGMAGPHLQNVARIKGAKVTAVCDPQPERAQAVAASLNATAFADHRAMLAQDSLDACFVCVLPAGHGSIELDLAQAGVPFYVEKPVHLSLSAAQKVLEALAAKNTIAAAGYHWRYTKAAQQTLTFVNKKGRPALIEGWWYSSFVSVPWWRQIKLSGGQLVEQATHIVDMARYLAGEVDTVYALAHTGSMADIENYDIHDVSIASLHFENGAIGQITTGCIAEEAGGPRVDVTVKGRNWHAWTNAGMSRLVDARGSKEINSNQDWTAQIHNADKAFINAVQSNNASKLLSTYASGVQTLAVALAANKSIATGKPVKVPRVV